jgi:transcriptional regulator GlxA family with amidase domain
MLDTGQLDRIAAPPAGHFRRSVRLTGHRPISSAAAAQLVTYIDYLRSHILVTSRAREYELIADTGTQLLAALILAAFPNTAQADSSPSDHHDASTTALRRAVSYVDDNAHLPLSLADIADHVHMTPRGVQYLFRRHMDCTPMQYLRQVRLDLAHRDLQVGTPDRCTVAEVANRWGFSHQSRFAHYYKQAYGTSPHRTLKR